MGVTKLKDNQVTESVDLTSEVTGILPIANGGTGVSSGAGDMETSTYDPAGIVQQVVGLSAIQTLTNKKLTGGPAVDYIRDTTNGNRVLSFAANLPSYNYVEVTATNNGTYPTIKALPGNTDTNVGLNLQTTGTGTIQANGVNVVDLSSAQSLTHKNLTDATNTFPTLNQNTTGSAATLTTSRTVQTNLASTSSASFNGSANITPGVTGTLPVGNGGTGRTTATTAYGLIAAGTTATGAQQTVSPGTSGQVLTSNGSSALPSFQTAPAGFSWSVITASQTAAASNGYITNSASLIVITLPASPSLGDTIKVHAGGGPDYSTGGWKLAQPTGANVRFGNTATTTGTSGSLASTSAGDTIEVVCILAGSSADWAVISSIGNITVI